MAKETPPTGYVSKFNKEERSHSVGYFGPDGKFNAVSDHDQYDDAAKEVARLNGGGAPFTDEHVQQLAAQLGPKLAEQLGQRGSSAEGDQVGAEQHKGMMRDFVALWEAAGIQGFACADQSKVPQLLAAIQKFKAVK
jgi:hypothetical protein